MEYLTQEQIEYLKSFIAELHEKVPHGSIGENENFLGDVVNRGYGSYMFFVSEGGGYQMFHGDIYVSAPNVLIAIGYESLFLPGEKFRNELDEIAEKTGVCVYESLGNHVTVSEPNALGFVNVPLFREDGSRLTVDKFVTDYLFNVSRAANLARELEERVIPEINY